MEDNNVTKQNYHYYDNQINKWINIISQYFKVNYTYSFELNIIYQLHKNTIKIFYEKCM